MSLKPARSVWSAILGERCPRCREGRVFRGQFAMNRECPVCGLRFEREHGYFTGAMYVSYAIGIPAIALLTLVAWLVKPSWPLWALVLAAWVAFLPLVPWVFRCSRVSWIHLDRALDREEEEDPDDTRSGELARDGPDAW